LLDYLYDAWVAPAVSSVKPDLVVCYENGALRTFRAARAVGALCVLDAASVHYKAQREWLADSREADPRSVEERKALEIAAADAILTCSPLAAQTYLEAGVPSTKVFSVPLGTVVPRIEASRPSRGTACRFLFVGSVTRHKGGESLLKVFRDLAADRVPAQLTLIGGVVEHGLEKQLGQLANVVRIPFLPQARLFEEIATHDCLALPSRFDSFGMVVPEAMAVGVPAIVSERVGAKCIIEDHPEAGWIVPCDTQALKEQMLALVENRSLLLRASRAAREAARAYSWEHYRARVVRTLEMVYESHRSATHAR
jgi:glycosyltransferase involved in cell wall biosynthesis